MKMCMLISWRTKIYNEIKKFSASAQYLSRSPKWAARCYFSLVGIQKLICQYEVEKPYISAKKYNKYMYYQD